MDKALFTVGGYGQPQAGVLTWTLWPEAENLGSGKPQAGACFCGSLLTR